MLLTNAYEPDPRVRQEALSLIAMGCRVRILAWDRDRKSPAHESVEGVEVERVFLTSTHGRGVTQVAFYAWLYVRMFWRALRTPFDAVHCHDLDTLPLGFVLGRLRRRPVIYDAHESFPDMLAGSVPNIVRRALTRLETALIRRIDLLITVGETLRGHFVARGARRAVVVGNWKRLGEFSRTEWQNNEVRRKLGVPHDALVVSCITHLRRDRKIDELLEAVREEPDVYLVLAGSGALEDQVRRAAAANPRIVFVGFVSGTAIPDLTCAADVVFYGFDPENPNARFSAPNKLFEALAAGRPLITGDFGEIAAVVRAERCGVVLASYRPADIRKAFALLRDPEARGAMARNAARIGRTSWNWEQAEQTLYREYTTLLPGLQAPRSGSSLELTRVVAEH